MLRLSCALFRRRFETAEPSPHRQGCAACDAWAQRLEELRRRAAPVPAFLKSRLRDIPNQEADCEQVDRLFRSLRPGARADAGAALHLASCQRCATLFGALAPAFSNAAEPLQPALAVGLRRVPERSRRAPIVWLPDLSLAAAASCVLTVLLLMVAGDAEALFLRTTGALSGQASSITRASEEQGRVWREQVGRRLIAFPRIANEGMRSSLGDLAEAGARLREAAVVEQLVEIFLIPMKTILDEDSGAGESAAREPRRD